MKVYGKDKHNGEESFYRDGYTDMRGKFDYTQTSGDKADRIVRFAILVCSDGYGCDIVEVDGVGPGLAEHRQERVEHRAQVRGNKGH